MFSRDEMQRAIEDALKSMEGIALELYRRGRAAAEVELEEARERNTDLRTMLEQVTRDRDHIEESVVRLEAQRDEARALVDQLGAARDKAEAELRELQRSTSEALAQAVEWQRERDEARAEVERLQTERQDALNALHVVSVSAYRRGAAAMRKRCEELVKHNSHEDGLGMGSQRMESALSALPTPEEK